MKIAKQKQAKVLKSISGKMFRLSRQKFVFVILHCYLIVCSFCLSANFTRVCAQQLAAFQNSKDTAQSASNKSPESQAPNAAQNERSSPYKTLRYDEDWSHLRAAAKRQNLVDSIKYIQLGAEKSYLTIGGDVKPRFEFFHNEAWGAAGRAARNSYLLQRYMLHFDFHFNSRWRIFVEFKSGIETGRAGGPRLIDENHADVNQMFVDVGLGRKVATTTADEKGSLKSRTVNPITLRFGRQELSYGAGRLVAPREGTNVRQSFDALRAIFQTGRWRADVFVAKPVEIDRSSFDDAQNDATFWGVYAVRSGVKVLPGQGSVDVYYLGIDHKLARFDQGLAREIRQTFGTRIWGTRKDWEYNHELIFQTGQFRNAKILAGAASYNIAYNMRQKFLKPKFGLNGDVISGDRNPNKTRLNTFNPLFPKNGYYGDTNLLTPANLIDVIPSAKFSLTKQLSATFETFFFWRQSLRDGVYMPGGMLAKSGNQSRARFVGTQALIELQYELNQHATLTTTYAHFAPGNFVREMPSGNKAVNYFTTYLQFKF